MRTPVTIPAPGRPRPAHSTQSAQSGYARSLLLFMIILLLASLAVWASHWPACSSPGRIGRWL